MSYLSRGKWHVAKGVLTNLGVNRIDIEIRPGKKPYPINIQVDQPVGVSLKYGYGKIIFETTVAALEPAAHTDTAIDQQATAAGGGTIALAVPTQIELVERRKYFRVTVPKSLKVNVTVWHRRHTADDGTVNTPPENYWKAKLIDLSAGGAQITIDAAQKPDFKRGQFIGLRFTPMPYERPLMFNAQIRNILPTANDQSICLGLQIVGLEASSKGHEVLQQLCNVAEQYYQINQSGAKQQDMQKTQLISSIAKTAVRTAGSDRR